MPKMPPILVAELFPEVSRRLLDLLRSLAPDEWHRPTVSSRRTVKDIVSHLLDGSLRRLSVQRDGYAPPDGSGRPRSGEPLVAFLTRLNDEWEVGTRRLSPPVLIALTEWADAGLAELFRSLDPHGPAAFPVAWAGEERSENWMDVAGTTPRSGTTPSNSSTPPAGPARSWGGTCTTRAWTRSCGRCRSRFSASRPRSGRSWQSKSPARPGGAWFVERRADGWVQVPELPRKPTATVTMDEQTAWKVVTKRRSREAVRQQFPGIRVAGDEPLGLHALDTVSVMA